MKCCWKSLCLLAIGIQLMSTCFSQDVGFSQFYDQPLLRNPALAGVFTGDARFTASYRNQWQSVTIPYRTFGFSAEFKVPLHLVENDNATIALQLVKDVAGTSEFSTTQVLPAFNYSFPLDSYGDYYLSVAFMAGWMQQRFDPTKLVLNDQFLFASNGTFSILPASRQVFDNTSVNYFDISTGVSHSGVIWGETNYFIGAGLFHLTRPQVGFFENNKITLNKKLAFNIGIAAPSGETNQIIGYGDLFTQFGKGFKPEGVTTGQLGVLYDYGLFVEDDIRESVALGCLYRFDDAVIPVVQLQLDKFLISASYDFNTSKLVTASKSRGGLELVLSYRGNLRNFQWKCPRFSR